MRWQALLVVVALACAGCGEAKREIDTPGPAPPYNPKEAAIDPALIHHDPQAMEKLEEETAPPSDAAPNNVPPDIKAKEDAADNEMPEKN